MNGFFSPEALEALQEAYQMQLTPEEQDIDQVTGLPTNQVSNTSPWHGKVEMWKYPDGKTPTKQGEIMYIHANEEEEELAEGEEVEYENEVEEESIEEGYAEEEENSDEAMSEAEVDALIQELLESDEDEN